MGTLILVDNYGRNPVLFVWLFEIEKSIPFPIVYTFQVTPNHESSIESFNICELYLLGNMKL